MSDTLFYSLLRVAIGTQDELFEIPTETEWSEQFNMAVKQSLVGICFAGLQNLGANADDGYAQIGISEDLYLNWMGMATQIQLRNEIVNAQCVELQKFFLSEGHNSSILKGQGIAALYGEFLSTLRQSGDIDVWLPGGMSKVLEYAWGKYGDVEYDYINAHLPVYKDTEVELHWRAQSLTNLFLNRRLQRWLESPGVQKSILGGRARLEDGNDIVVPSSEFNAFYILLHCYHHMFESGLGLRQLMDYFFVLRDFKRKSDVSLLFFRFGMKKFASGVMWIMKEVFGLEDDFLLYEASEHEGRFLLDEVMQNGNFGYHDDRVKNVGKGKINELWRNLQHNWHLASHYPAELIWQPVWLVYHFFWKRLKIIFK